MITESLSANANPLLASIFDAKTAKGTLKHEIVKRDIDCIIAKVKSEGMCVLC
jgi:hypothetical protein